jgi:predicted phage terminase large subunit-like protein
VSAPRRWEIEGVSAEDVAHRRERERYLEELRAATGPQPLKLRPKQQIGTGSKVMLLGGRQSGKTASGGEWMADRILADEGEYAIVNVTFGQARDVQVEHPKSGLLVALARRGIHVKRWGANRGGWSWNRSIGELRNGDRVAARIDGAIEGCERIQGHSISAYWLDELRLIPDKAARQTVNESLEYALSGSETPQRVLTSATRPTGFIKELIKSGEWDVRWLPMAENEANLPAEYFRQMMTLADTRLGRQEVGGELLEDVEGALWRTAWFQNVDRWPHTAAPGGTLRRVVLGLDAAGGQGGSAQAMVAAGLGWDNRIYIVHADAMRGSVNEWLKRAIRTAQTLGVAEIVVERNHGDQFLLAALETAMKDLGVRVPYRPLWVSKGKAERAVPVATLYELGNVTHVGEMVALEVQQEAFTGAPGDASDLVDALVHAVMPLMGYGSGDGLGEAVDAIPYSDYAGDGVIAYS